MGIGKHGMSLRESYEAQNSVEWSPSKTAKSSHIATSGQAHHAAHPMAKAKGKHSAAKSARKAPSFKQKGGGGGHHREY